MIKGHLTICKVYNDGTQEVVLDNANMITKGLGSTFIDIQKGKGSNYADDFVPYYFQIGTSSVDTNTFDAATSAYFYHLSTPLTWSEYGEDTELLLYERYRGFYASSEDSGVTYTEMYGTSAPLSSIVFSGSDQYFVKVTPDKRTKYLLDSMEAEIVLDENTANGQNITEVGLYAKNPRGYKEDSPLLMAYRSFVSVPKSSDFSLVMHWTIGFLGLSTNVDNYYFGGGGIFTGPSIAQGQFPVVSGPKPQGTK